MTHYHFTDGYAYDASTFGQTNSTSGIWVPKTNPSVTYGTNGFFLKFENAGNMDLDSSGAINFQLIRNTNSKIQIHLQIILYFKSLIITRSLSSRNLDGSDWSQGNLYLSGLATRESYWIWLTGKYYWEVKI